MCQDCAHQLGDGLIGFTEKERQKGALESNKAQDKPELEQLEHLLGLHLNQYGA